MMGYFIDIISQIYFNSFLMLVFNLLRQPQHTSTKFKIDTLC